jgi:hypothetical protein
MKRARDNSTRHNSRLVNLRVITPSLPIIISDSEDENEKGPTKKRTNNRTSPISYVSEPFPIDLAAEVLIVVLGNNSEDDPEEYVTHRDMSALILALASDRMDKKLLDYDAFWWILATKWWANEQFMNSTSQNYVADLQYPPHIGQLKPQHTVAQKFKDRLFQLPFYPRRDQTWRQLYTQWMISDSAPCRCQGIHCENFALRSHNFRCSFHSSGQSYAKDYACNNVSRLLLDRCRIGVNALIDEPTSMNVISYQINLLGLVNRLYFIFHRNQRITQRQAYKILIKLATEPSWSRISERHRLWFMSLIIHRCEKRSDIDVEAWSKIDMMDGCTASRCFLHFNV